MYWNLQTGKILYIFDIINLMNSIMFDGQQSDERILYTIFPHPFTKNISLIKIIILAVLFLIMFFVISTVAIPIANFIRLIGLIGSFGFFIVALWWTNAMYQKSVCYITDRRIIRFEMISPFYMTKRALFWNEALKAKGYSTNILYRTFNIGSVQVEPTIAEHENVYVGDVFMYNDVANYIDKILFTFKNKPAEVSELKPFVAKPKGQRD
jgi:hypothetical protein